MFSPYQEPIEWMEKLNPNSTLNTISGYAEIFGAVELDKFQNALRMLQQAYPILQIRIKDNLLSSKSIELNEQFAELDGYDFSNEPEPYKQALLFIKEKNKKALPLDDSFLFKNALIKISSTHFIWFLQIHHWITDGWSVALIFQKISNFYAFPAQSFEQFPLNYSYEKYFQSADYERDKMFWENEQLTPSFPTHHQAFPSERISFSLSSRLIRLLKTFCNHHHITPFHFILTIWAIYEYRIAESNQVTVGLPLLNRKNKKDKNSIGLFCNFLPFCLAIEDSESVSDIFQKVKETLRNLYKHQSFPLSELTRFHQEKGAIGRFFDKMISYEIHTYGNKFADFPSKLHYLPHYQDDNKMTIHWMEYSFQDEVQIAIDYATDYFNRSKIKGLLETWQTIAFALVRNPSQKISNIPFLNHKTQTQWNQICIGKEEPIVYPNLWERLEAFVQLHPQKNALIFQNQSVSFEFLHHQGQCVAQYLLQHQFLTVSSPVIALAFERSEALVVGILGVICAGGTFLILDVANQPERSNQILQQSKCKVVLTNLDDFALPSAQIIQWEAINFGEKVDFLNYSPLIPQIAYHIYTSGTTGFPKGIEISYSNFAYILQSWHKAYQLENATVLSWANSTFDVFIGDIGRSILSGNTLVLTDKNERLLPEKIIQLIERYAVTHLEVVPVFAELLVEKLSQMNFDSLQSLKYWIVGSDKFTKQLYLRLQDNLPLYTQIINSYGVSECTIDTAFMDCRQIQSIENEIIPIGVPFENQSIYVMDKCLQPCPPYQLGKIFIGGKGVGSYLDNVLMQENFIQHPQWGKLYATGDWGFWEAEKGITFWGRKDSQLKLNGLRIDLKEIEYTASLFPSLKQGVAFLNQYQQIVLAYRLESQTQPMSLQNFLIQKLPSYMFPTFFWELSTLPINANGKIDINELQKKWELVFSIEKENNSPETEKEKILVEIWKKIFEKPIRKNSNFWVLGGNSIQAIRMIGLLQSYQFELTLQQLFEHPILEDLAIQIQPLREQKEQNTIFEIQADEMQRVLNVLGKKLK